MSVRPFVSCCNSGSCKKVIKVKGESREGVKIFSVCVNVIYLLIHTQSQWTKTEMCNIISKVNDDLCVSSVPMTENE